MGESRTERLAVAFGECRLPKAEWTHEAHLRVGLWHLLRDPPGAALDRLRDGIRRYTLATGGANTDTSGYHETITRFYVCAIGRFLAAADRTRTVDDLADDLVRACGDKVLPLRHWPRERLMSPEARREWVEPDLLPLAEPRSVESPQPDGCCRAGQGSVGATAGPGGDRGVGPASRAGPASRLVTLAG